MITIDGLAASGKSTLGKSLAKRLGYTFFSSGMFYRMAGLLWVESAKGPLDEGAVSHLLKAHSIDLVKGKDGGLVAKIDGNEVNAKLFTPEVSEATSQVSALKVVREWLLEKQRNVFPGENLVAEGRDMGTVVFPKANLKFFVVADLQTRIDRRINQLQKGQQDSESINSLKRKMEIEIIERDNRDSHRQNSPTIPAEDAIQVDNSAQTLTEVVESMYDFVAKRGLIA